MMAVVVMIFMMHGAVPFGSLCSLRAGSSGLGRKCHALRHLRAGLSRFAPSGLGSQRYCGLVLPKNEAAMPKEIFKDRKTARPSRGPRAQRDYHLSASRWLTEGELLPCFAR